MIKFLMNVYNEETDKDEQQGFTVKADWAKDWIRKNYDMSLGEFMEIYTTEDSHEMYEDALMEGMIQ